MRGLALGTIIACLQLGGCKADPTLRAALLADATASENASWARPSHVASPTPGTFGDAAEPVIAKIVAGVARLPSAEVILASPPTPPIAITSPCDAFAIAWDPAALTEACRTESATRAASLAPLLEATHARDAGLPPSLRETDPAIILPRTRAVFLALRDLDIEAHVARASSGRPDPFVTCADRLALVRDLLWGGLLLADLIAQTTLVQVLTVCDRAAFVEPVEDRRKLADVADVIARGMPPFAGIARRENVLIQVRTWGAELADDERAHLPATLRGAVGPFAAPREEWAPFRARADAVDAALRAPTSEERARRVKELDDHAPKDAPTWAGYLAHHDRHAAAIEVFAWALRVTADEQDGKTPAPLPPSLAAFTKVERTDGVLEVYVAIPSEPPREIHLRFGRLP